MNAINTIIERLNEVFAPMDAEVLTNSQEWAINRRAAIQTFMTSDEGRALRFNAYAFYEQLHAIAGGKTWYNVLNGNTDEYIQSFVTKNCNEVVKKRNASIAAKLNKAGVTEVISENFVNTTDGFNGVFMVSTNVGIKRVTIDTVHAGGYNVQCLHMRVLVKIK